MNDVPFRFSFEPTFSDWNFSYDLTAGLPDSQELRGLGDMAQSTTLYDAKDQPVFTIFKEQRIEIPLEKMSPNFIKAVLSIEDQRFYEHTGVDAVVAMARAGTVAVLLPGAYHVLRETKLPPLDARFVGHSEEHLVLRSPRAAQYKVGDVVYGIPRHICPTVALQSEVMTVVEGVAGERWPVVARASPVPPATSRTATRSLAAASA